MNAARAELPDDVEMLKALVLAQQSLLSERAVEIEHLKLIIAKLKRLQFGHRSEKIDREIEQLEPPALRIAGTRSNRIVCANANMTPNYAFEPTRFSATALRRGSTRRWAAKSNSSHVTGS